MNADWVANVRANEDVTIEVGSQAFNARGRVEEGAERGRLFAAHVAAAPALREGTRP